MTLQEIAAARPRKGKGKSKQGKPLSPVEAERRRRQAAQEEARDHRDHVLTFRQWCSVNGFSKSTGIRILKSDDRPEVMQLSERRIGIKESANAAWQASRVR